MEYANGLVASIGVEGEDRERLSSESCLAVAGGTKGRESAGFTCTAADAG